MALRVLLTPVLVLTFVLALCTTWASAAVRSDRLLPETTKGYLSIVDVEQLHKKWDATQLGQLMNDETMKPFAEDLQRQLKNKFSQTGVKLMVTVDDLKGIADGELAIALIQPENDKKQHAMALLVEVGQHRAKAQTLLEKVSKNQIEKGAKKTSLKQGAVEITGFVLPKKKELPDGAQVFYFLHDGLLVAVDHAKTAQDLAARLSGDTKHSLHELASFTAVMKKLEEESGDLKPDVRWYVDPFGYAEVSRAAQGGRKKRGTDMLKVLANQGFKAIQAAGGHVNLMTGEHEALHRTFVYAPTVSDAAEGQRFKLAARMLDFPNKQNLKPLEWVPRDLATHWAFNWKIRESFGYLGSLVDEVAGEPGVFEEVLKSIALDRNGPQVDLKKELVAFAGERVTVMSDCRLPVTPKSERLLIAIEITNEAAVAKAINKIMSADPSAHKHEFEGREIWEIINDDAPVEVETVQIEGVEFVAAGNEEMADDEKDEEDKPMIPNSSVTIAHGHLLISTHIDYLKEILKPKDKPETLGDAADYKTVNGALDKLRKMNEDSFLTFTRTDEAYRATYELIRDGKMPESETILGKVLNKMLGPDEEGVLREQQIDGTKLPEFDVVRRFLGPAGAQVRSLPDGWLMTGCLLAK